MHEMTSVSTKNQEINKPMGNENSVPEAKAAQQNTNDEIATLSDVTFVSELKTTMTSAVSQPSAAEVPDKSSSNDTTKRNYEQNAEVENTHSGSNEVTQLATTFGKIRIIEPVSHNAREGDDNENSTSRKVIPECSEEKASVLNALETINDTKNNNVDKNTAVPVMPNLPGEETVASVIKNSQLTIDNPEVEVTPKNAKEEEVSILREIEELPTCSKSLQHIQTVASIKGPDENLKAAHKSHLPTMETPLVEKLSMQNTYSNMEVGARTNDKAKISDKLDIGDVNDASLATQQESMPENVLKNITNLANTTVTSKEDSKTSTPSASSVKNEQLLHYINPITLEAKFFLKTVAENIGNFSVFDKDLIDALESIMITINALLKTTKDRYINETKRVKLVPAMEMAFIRRSFVCVKCHKFVGNNAAGAAAHLANLHEMEDEGEKKKSKKNKRKSGRKQQNEPSPESNAMEILDRNPSSQNIASKETSSASSKETQKQDSDSKDATTSKEKKANEKPVKQPILSCPPKQKKSKATKEKPKAPATQATATNVQTNSNTPQSTNKNPTKAAEKKDRTGPAKNAKGKTMKQQLPKKARALFNNNMQQFFYDHVQLGNALKYIPAYDKIEKDLLNLLHTVFPNKTIKLFKFGSRISGVGSRDSDLDIYVDIDNNFNNFEDRPSAQTIAHITKVRDALNKNKGIWKHLIAIINTRVPILRVLNSSTGIECDIGFSNSLGYCNTKLVQYFLDVQPIARCLCIFLKKWLDRSKLHGNFSSYSIILMVIYYLQVNKLLPSVQKLQIGLTKKLFVGPWLANFQEKTLKELEIDEVGMNTQSVKILLKNFFDFYWKFPFDKCAVCPYFGKLHMMNDEIEMIMPKRYVDYVHGIGSDYRLEVANKAMIVQDPIQLNHNVTKSVSANTLVLLKDYLEHSVKLFSEINN